MNLGETSDLLSFIARIDNRRVDDAAVVAWREILADLPFVDCRDAALAHFGSTDAYLMPVHIRRGALEVDRDRRRQARELAEADALRELEADPTRHDRSPAVLALIADLRDRLHPTDPRHIRRPDMLAADRARERAQRAEPNPHYDPTATPTAVGSDPPDDDTGEST